MGDPVAEKTTRIARPVRLDDEQRDASVTEGEHIERMGAFINRKKK